MASKIASLARTQIVFWKKVAIMIDAGAPFFKCIETALASTNDPNLQQAMNMWIIENKEKDDFEEKSPLSDALEAFPAFFPPFIIDAIRVAEETKTRLNIYHALVDYLEKEVTFGD